MILIGLGANLPSAWGPPEKTLEAALAALGDAGIGVERRSRWYRSAPWPPGEQPWYVNAVASLATGLDPGALLAELHRLEARFGRTRRHRNEPRVLDLDLLDYDGRVQEEAPVLPHPRLHERAFVLLPLAEIAPDWRHPLSGAGVWELVARLPPGHGAEAM
ncbi:MAG TPA: 2-amino-4-hydroxy-6-hydroxymethyldihydropteridine diphosphokinase [Stellaceae bacterium]|jgi:2-amino-4-hydroxy-6-hydroxymethyldihydropteridine diphosphokinase|nr:2-amino-4-hydroxy-6-hydroxymethyldihydropteridine diphosphokinase [Stellaceae bacterium]